MIHDPDSRYCCTCGHDFGRLYDEPIRCDACCASERQAMICAREADDISADRDEWREQHATLLSIYQRLTEQHAALRQAGWAALNALDRLMGDTDMDDDGSPEMRAMRMLVRALEDTDG